MAAALLQGHYSTRPELLSQHYSQLGGLPVRYCAERACWCGITQVSRGSPRTCRFAACHTHFLHVVLEPQCHLLTCFIHEMWKAALYLFAFKTHKEEERTARDRLRESGNRALCLCTRCSNRDRLTKKETSDWGSETQAEYFQTLLTHLQKNWWKPKDNCGLLQLWFTLITIQKISFFTSSLVMK